MIKGRLKYTASFCALIYRSAMVCAPAVRFGYDLLASAPAVLNHRKMIVMFTVSVM